MKAASNNRHHICPDPASGQHPQQGSLIVIISEAEAERWRSPEATQPVKCKWGPGMWDFKGALFSRVVLCLTPPLEEEGVRHMPGPGAMWPCNWRACFIALTASKHSGAILKVGDYEEMDRPGFLILSLPTGNTSFSVQCIVWLFLLNWTCKSAVFSIQFQHE